MERRLVVVPHAPLLKNSLQRAIMHRGPKDFISGVTQRRITRRKHSDVVADREALRLDRESRDRTPTALGQDIVEQYRIETADDEIAVRIHVVIIRNRLNAKLALA